MAPILYYLNLSPPARAVMLTIKELGIDVEIKEVNLREGEQLTPEYIKMNPQHTIPTLDDDGFIIWDSHAICAYLVGKYGKDDSLYPKDLQKRAVIDQRLHFDSGLLFPRLRGIFESVIFCGQKEIPKDKVEGFQKALGFLEAFIGNMSWLAGDQLTLADLCIMPAVSSFEIVNGPIDASRYPKLAAWFERCKKLPYYEINIEGNKALAAAFNEKLKQ